MVPLHQKDQNPQLTATLRDVNQLGGHTLSCKFMAKRNGTGTIRKAWEFPKVPLHYRDHRENDMLAKR